MTRFRPIKLAKKVLIIEDSNSFALILKQMIEETHAIKTDIASTLNSAIKTLDAYPDEYFAAIVDLTLPDAPNGEAVDMVISSGIPAIVFTGTSDHSIQEDLWAKGIADYAHKSSLSSLEYVVWMIQRINKNRLTKVLVIDDSKSSRLMMEKLLLLQKFQVLTAKKGSDAIKILEQVPDIKLAIIDCYMNQHEGVKLTAEIREKYSFNELEIIGVSSFGGGTISAQFIKSGATDFLLKPFAPEEFLCRVNSSIERLEYYQELKTINEQKNQFLGIAAHDIRGPLASINTASNFLLDKFKTDDKRRPLLKMINTASGDAIHLLEDLLDISAIESGNLNLNKKKYLLNGIIDERVNLYSPEANKKSIDLFFEIDGNDITVNVDLIKIKQAIDNLITNSIKYTPTEGQISISASCDKEVKIIIEDSGPGIPQKEVSEIFDPFTISSTRSTAGEKQTGLGLAIVKKIADAHKGKLTYSKSKELGGACFCLTIPLDQD